VSFEVTIPGGHVEATEAGFIGHVLISRAEPPFASYGPFETREEAEQEVFSFWEWRAECSRLWLEERRRESKRRTEEFIARVREQRAEARRRLIRTGTSAVKLNGFIYRRSEYASLRQTQPATRPRQARRTVRQRPRRYVAHARRGPPSPSGDDDDHDVARLQANAEAAGFSHISETIADELRRLTEGRQP
jgi:hypothetical protein